MIRLIVINHIIGLTGQVSAGVPILLISVVLARCVGVGQDGYFSIIIGSSAVIFVTTNVVNDIVGS